MTNPSRRRIRRAGVGYLLLAIAAAIPAGWQLALGEGWLGVWMLAAACLAGRCSTAMQTIARQQARLTDPRRTDGRAW